MVKGGWYASGIWAFEHWVAGVLVGSGSGFQNKSDPSPTFFFIYGPDPVFFSTVGSGSGFFSWVGSGLDPVQPGFYDTFAYLDLRKYGQNDHKMLKKHNL